MTVLYRYQYLDDRAVHVSTGNAAEAHRTPVVPAAVPASIPMGLHSSNNFSSMLCVRIPSGRLYFSSLNHICMEQDETRCIRERRR